MTDEEFEVFLSSAMEELKNKQDSLEEQYSLDSWSWFDQKTEKLQFFDEADNVVIEADVIEIGSYSAKSNTWKWAWGNRWVLPALRKKAEPLKALEELTDTEIFGYEAAFGIEDETMAWELVAMSVKHLGAIGCYSAPVSGGPTIFLAIMNAQRIS